MSTRSRPTTTRSAPATIIARSPSPATFTTSISPTWPRTTGQSIANAPEATWALGALYNNGPFGASLINKWVGSRYGDTGLKQGLEPFNQLDAAVHYTVQRPPLPPINLKLQVNNIIDSRKIIEFDLYAGSKSTPICFTQPGRSAFFSIEVPI